MTIYKILKADGKDCGILRDEKDSIPFDPANTDYQAFKKDINEGAELLDAEGNVMTDAQAFVKELP